jgi:hypothetical protein
MKPELYASSAAVGLLKGFSPMPHQLEVDVVVPHQERGLPGFGEFLLVELAAHEALVGRVSRYHAAGQLATDRGDAYLGDLAKTEDAVPAPLMRQMLRYNLKMQLLGHLQLDSGAGKFKFSVGERAFATPGSKVRVPSDAALAFLCNVGLEDDPTATPLGHLVYGQRELKNVPVRFSVGRLKSRRSFVFARAGYGKSNLIKYLMSQLYSSPPDVRGFRRLSAAGHRGGFYPGGKAGHGVRQPPAQPQLGSMERVGGVARQGRVRSRRAADRQAPAIQGSQGGCQSWSNQKQSGVAHPAAAPIRRDAG